jgi:hypothetical protein
VTVEPADEAPREAAVTAAPGFADAVTFAFGDPGERIYGLARIGLAEGTASGLAVLFEGHDPVAARAAGAVEVAEPAWEAIDAGGVRARVVEPLRAWTVVFDGGEDGGFDLEFRALSTPAELAEDAPPARMGGMRGYEQLCAVTGTVRTRAGERRLSCGGQRSRTWGVVDWTDLDLARTVGGWLGDDTGFALTAVRPAGAGGHDEEAVSAWIFEGGAPVAVGDPRLSTTTDEEGRQRRAGLELWIGEGDDERARRIAGEVVCGTTLDLGRLRLDAAFFAWRMEGREGVGRYDVLRRAG